MKTTLRLLKFLRPFFWEICLSILLGIATLSAGIGMLGTSAFLISSAALHPSIADLQVAIVGVRFFGISRAFFRYLERLVSHSVNLRILSRLREWFYRQIESSPPAELYTQKAGDLLDRVMGNLEILENFYVRVVSPVVVAFVVGIGVCLFIGGFGEGLGLILGLGLLLNGLILPILSILITRKNARKMTKTRGELSAATIDLLQGLEVLQSHGVEKRWMEVIKHKGKEAGRWQNKITLLNGLNSGLSLLMQNLTILALLWAAIPKVTTGEMSGVSLAVVVLMALASFESVGALPQAAVMLNASIESARRLFEVGSIQPTNTTLKPLSENWQPKRIKVEDVSFDYSGDQSFRLHAISFDLVRGKKLALIGPSGAGKTSLVNLILQFWQPTQGRIWLDELNAGDLDADRVRAYFAVISQNTWLFSASLRENLLLADPRADDQRLLNALRQAELADWVSRLPQGLDTWLGDQGLRLSGGERQRVAIARAILQDRPFVLLDEPVENLDPLNAEHVLETIFQLFKDRGLLLITHDPSKLYLMDEILVLENGSIVEFGRYDDLIAKKGRLTGLVEIQTQTLA